MVKMQRFRIRHKVFPASMASFLNIPITVKTKDANGVETEKTISLLDHIYASVDFSEPFTSIDHLLLTLPPEYAESVKNYYEEREIRRNHPSFLNEPHLLPPPRRPPQLESEFSETKMEWRIDSPDQDEGSVVGDVIVNTVGLNRALVFLDNYDFGDSPVKIDDPNTTTVVHVPVNETQPVNHTPNEPWENKFEFSITMEKKLESGVLTKTYFEVNGSMQDYRNETSGVSYEVRKFTYNRPVKTPVKTPVKPPVKPPVKTPVKPPVKKPVVSPMVWQRTPSPEYEETTIAYRCAVCYRQFIHYDGLSVHCKRTKHRLPAVFRRKPRWYYY